MDFGSPKERQLRITRLKSSVVEPHSRFGCSGMKLHELYGVLYGCGCARIPPNMQSGKAAKGIDERPLSSSLIARLASTASLFVWLLWGLLDRSRDRTLNPVVSNADDFDHIDVAHL